MEGTKMQCPKCQFENREGAKFCGDCGHKFEIACPECGTNNRAGNKFCDECGHKLTSTPTTTSQNLSFDEKLAKIQKYLPQGLTEKILSQRDKIEGERKQATVMFCDMKGFTHLSEKLDPEDAYTIMDAVYEILIHKVHDYEGTVNEMIGDGIMALFGAPIALEDAAQRAIRSSLSIHREMAKFSDKLKQEKEDIPPFKMRIGIHTGPVVVGTLGNDLRVEFKAVGDTVNIASRMEGLAEPGTTYITGDTFKLTEGFFRFEALGERKIKGREKPVQIYRVIAPSTRRTRFDVSTERGLTPFVGRARELELLLDGFGRAKEGRGQAFSIIAEAGVGKSRLLYEFRKAVINEDVTFLEGKCLSYSRGVAYHPIIDILKSSFDVREGDHDLAIKKRVKKGLQIFGVDEASTLPYLLELLSVQDSGIDKIPMSPEAKKDRTMEAVKRISLKGSEIRPLIIATEDLHWIDKSSEEYLKDLMDSISGARVFLLFTYRPEFVHTWGVKSYHSQVNLNRVSNRESLAMVTHLLGSKKIDRDLEELILEKTEGVPFFIEEFIKSLKDLKIIKKKKNAYHLATDMQAVSIPSTIQDVIMARVDTLFQGAKELLQTGSVIEREFSYELLKRVTGTSQEELLSHLSILKDSELLYERGIYPESTYIFRHALTREVVYDSILTKKKIKLHGEVGDVIEELYKDNLSEHYGILAQHYMASENFEGGAKYSQLAGRKAEKDASFTHAITYAKKRIYCLERLPVADDIQKRIIDARTTFGLYLTQLGNFAAAKEAIDPIIDVTLSSGYKRRISQIYTLIGIYYNRIEIDSPRALDYLKKALSVAAEIDDKLSFYFANYWLGVALSGVCEFEKAGYHIKKALDITMAANNPSGIAAMKGTISNAVYNYQGKVELGFQTSHEALRIAEKSDDIYSKTWGYTYHGWSCYCKGLLEEAIVLLLKGAGLSEKISSFRQNFDANRSLAHCYLDMGDYEKSKYHSNKAILIAEQGRYCLDEIYFSKILFATAKVMNNERDIRLESLYGYTAKNKLRADDGWRRRYIGQILLNYKRLSEADDWIKRAIKADKKNGVMWSLARDYALYAELYKRRGNPEKARENLSKAIEILKECGADGWVEKYEEELSALS
jgi:class 3 adenylate cyclase/tetratricopeptide (TPR) repeat protein